jgi:hypothetical protein
VQIGIKIRRKQGIGRCEQAYRLLDDTAHGRCPVWRAADPGADTEIRTGGGVRPCAQRIRRRLGAKRAERNCASFIQSR